MTSGSLNPSFRFAGSADADVFRGGMDAPIIMNGAIVVKPPSRLAPRSQTLFGNALVPATLLRPSIQLWERARLRVPAIAPRDRELSGEIQDSSGDGAKNIPGA